MAASTEEELCVLAVGTVAGAAVGEAAWITIGGGDCALATEIDIIAKNDR